MHKQTFYELAVEDWKQDNHEIYPSLETFLRVWRNDFPDLVIPKYNTLGACTTCEDLRNKRNAHSKRTEQWGFWDSQLKTHIRQFAAGGFLFILFVKDFISLKYFFRTYFKKRTRWQFFIISSQILVNRY